MGDNNKLFIFLTEMDETIYNLAQKMEDRLFDDPKSACSNARSLLEAIVNHVLEIEEQYEALKGTLAERISFLNREGYLPKENNKINNSMYILRKVGNLAVHEKSFDSLEDAIKLYKEAYTLTSWYAEVYGSGDIQIPKYRDPIIEKKQGMTPEEVEEMINKLIDEKNSSIAQTITNQQPNDEPLNEWNSQEQTIIQKDLPAGKSYLLRELKRLQESSKEAVESPEMFSGFKRYMHVDRKIQVDLEELIKKESHKSGPGLIIISGSVGDGKSHLLSYFKENLKEINDFKIYNDATESYERNKTAVETLSHELINFSDQKINDSNEKMIIAMNLGILNKFLEADHGEYSYEQLKEFVNQSKVFERDHSPNYSENAFHIITFSEYPPFELTENGAKSDFFEGIFEKIFSESVNNPFYTAFQMDMNSHQGFKGIVHYNYQYLMNDQVQKTIIQLMIQAILRKKIVLSTRSILNFIADILIPESYLEESEYGWNALDAFDNSVPNLLFSRRNRSIILDAMAELDPIHSRNQTFDNIILEMNTFDFKKDVVNKYLSNTNFFPKFEEIINDEQIDSVDGTELLMPNDLSKMLIRVSFLTDKSFFESVIQESYESFIYYLYHFNINNKNIVNKFSSIVFDSMLKWKGSPKKYHIYIKDYYDFKIAQKLTIEAVADHLIDRDESVLKTFDTVIRVAFVEKNNSEPIYLEIDYHLYQLLLAVRQGYQQNYKDMEDAVNFVEFIDKVTNRGSNSSELLVHMPKENKIFRLEYSNLAGYTFEKE